MGELHLGSPFQVISDSAVNHVNSDGFESLTKKMPAQVLELKMCVNVPITHFHGRVSLLYARPASEQLRSIALVTR